MSQFENALPTGGPAKPTQKASVPLSITARERALLPLTFLWCFLAEDTILWAWPHGLGIFASTLGWYALLALALGRRAFTGRNHLLLLGLNLALGASFAIGSSLYFRLWNFLALLLLLPLHALSLAGCCRLPWWRIGMLGERFLLLIWGLFSHLGASWAALVPPKEHRSRRLGAAVAGGVMALVLVARRTGLLQPKLSFFRMHGALLRLILRLGIPSALQMTIAGFSWLVVTFLVNQYGVNVSAGNGVAIKIKDICQLFISAMASGATTMIAQNLGASKFERAKDVMYTAMKITCAMAAAMIVLVELFAPQMAAVFTNEAAVRDAAVLNLRIEILGQIFYAVFMVYHALAIGAGHSTFAMLSSFANCIVFRVVLSLLFNHLWGIYGLYAACAVAPSISVPLGWLYTRSGVWRRSLAKTEK